MAGEAAREVALKGGDPKVAIFSGADRAVVQARYPDKRMQTTTRTLDIVFDGYFPRGFVMVAEATEACTCETCGHPLAQPAPKYAFRWPQ